MTETSPLISGAKPSKPPPRLKVLVIDPHPESRSLMKGALRSISQVESIMERSTPQGTDEILAGNPVDLVIIEEDLEKEGNPFKVVQQIRGLPDGSKTTFVLMSRNLTVESRRLGNEAGILGYLSKPFDIKSLEQAIRDSRGRVSTNIKDTLNKVRRISFFTGFTDAELVRLLKICHTRKFQSGEPIFREGEKGDRLFVLLAGDVNIVKHGTEGETVLATMHPGDVFGEMAIVDAEPRSADAVPVSDAMLIEVHDQVLNNLEDVLALKLFRKFAILVTKKLREFTRDATKHS